MKLAEKQNNTIRELQESLLDIERASLEKKQAFKKFDSFVRRQIEQIKGGGVAALWKKGVKAFKAIFFDLTAILCLPLILLVRLISPIVTIRFNSLQSNRIAPFAINIEIYLAERKHGLHGKRVLDIFHFQSPTCNKELKKMWDRVILVSSFANILNRSNQLIPGGSRHVIPLRVNGDRDLHGFLSVTSPSLFFTKQEQVKGKQELEKIGVGINQFICFHARDAAYLERTFPMADWSYHNHRDCNIYNYLPAIEKLTEQGYFALRMGAIVKDKLNSNNKKIIDYASIGRSDFLDIYLSAKCRFFICDSAGIFALPTIFRRPVVRLNFVALEFVPTWGKDDLFIPRKLWLKQEARFLTFKEIFDSGLARSASDEVYEKLGLELIENTSEEVSAVIDEMEQRLRGSWVETSEDQELQKRFWSLFPENEFNKVFLSRIGAEFLRQNQDLLG